MNNSEDINVSMFDSSEGPAKTTLIDGVHTTQVQTGFSQSLRPRSFKKYMLTTHKFAVSLSEAGSEIIGF